MRISCAPRTSPAQLLACLRRHPEVIGADSVAGDMDAVSRTTATDVRHPEEVSDRLRDEPLVLDTRSTIVLGRLPEHTKGGPLGPPLVTTDQAPSEIGERLPTRIRLGFRSGPARAPRRAPRPAPAPRRRSGRGRTR
ncbi:Lrp/AsnC ligand binding domain-containing protein [Embleya sp. NPDC050154]|uniref:Lrp/AsnC ligand binding domain-containing protein n=1 Tax=Embleya sp. NPDC050154 TaxID=3363988 RepID=UPI003793F406